MSANSECIFCRIVAGDAPADIVHRDERTVAFRDLSPQAPVHVLVVPRDHIDDASQVATHHGEVIADMLAAARTVAENAGIAASGYRLVFNVGEDATNSVGHLHLHVLGGRRMSWPPG